MFKGAYTSKDHDISAVAVENNTKCSKISESYGCEPENFSIIWDPGKQIIPLSDSQQYSVEGAYLSWTKWRRILELAMAGVLRN